METEKYSMVNEEKLNRAIYGSIGSNGQLHGGVGEDASYEAKLAEYDRLGGLVKFGKYKVKTGSFFDFKAKKAIVDPKPILELRDLEGNKVELPVTDTIPPEVVAAERIAEKKVKEQAEKIEIKEAKSKERRKKKADDSDEE